MPLKLRFIGSFFSSFINVLPDCVKDTAVAWWKDFNIYITVGSYKYIEEHIGIRSDTVYYGQYLSSSSGQINFYRSEGTFSYIDPSDGSLIEDIVIPSNGLFTIPSTGICEIITDDGSHYPVCERAGNVLHDIDAHSVHISVSSPSWSETLYGSDYLNQCGFLNKTISDSLGYDWETEVNGSNITLDNNCLVPIANWIYDALLDVYGNIIYDINGEIIYVKTKINP